MPNKRPTGEGSDARSCCKKRKPTRPLPYSPLATTRPDGRTNTGEVVNRRVPTEDESRHPEYPAHHPSRVGGRMV